MKMYGESRRSMFAAFVVMAIVVGACGGGETSPTTAVPGASPTTSPSPATTSDSTTPDAAADGDVTVEVGDTEFGSVLVDSEGFSLYLFTNDARGPGTCADACASLWPAVPVAAAGEGIAESLLGSAEGAQGLQATYNGWPLYYYANDASPGDATGQAVGGVWFLVNVDGDAVAEEATSESEGGSGIYSEPGY